MPSSYTTNNGIEKPATGEQNNTWGGTANTDFDLIDTALDGFISITLSAATATVAITSGAASDGRNRVLLFTGSPGANCTVTVTPNTAHKVYYVYNGTTGGFSVIMAQGGGSGSTVTIANGYWSIIRLDGTGSNANVTRILDSFEVTTAVKAATLTAAASLAIKPGANATTAVQIQNVAGTSILNVDTTNGRVGVNTTTANYTADITLSTAGTADAIDIFALTRKSSGTPAAGFGGGLAFALQDAGGSLIASNKIQSVWTDASAANRYMRMDFFAGANNTSVVAMSIDRRANIGFGTVAPAASALVELSSTTGALLLTRLTTAQRDALTAVNGMIIYNSTTNKFQGYESSAWTNLI